MIRHEGETQLHEICDAILPLTKRNLVQLADAGGSKVLHFRMNTNPSDARVVQEGRQSSCRHVLVERVPACSGQLMSTCLCRE